MEGRQKDIRPEGNRGLDSVVATLATSGADLSVLESKINEVRQTIRNPESSDRQAANVALDSLVQEMHDKGIDLNEVQEAINAARQAIRG